MRENRSPASMNFAQASNEPKKARTGSHLSCLQTCVHVPFVYIVVLVFVYAVPFLVDLILITWFK